VHVDGTQVDHERVLAREGLITAVALEDLGRMRELVGAKHPAAGKGLAARVADVGPVALVLVLVRLQVGHRLAHRDSLTRFNFWEFGRLGQIFKIFFTFIQSLCYSRVPLYLKRKKI
jgi:hypothetical protein